MNPEPLFKRLGKKTFWVFVLENSAPIIILFVIWLALLVAEVIGIPDPDIDSLLTISIVLATAFLILFIAFAFGMAALRYYSYVFVLDENALRIKRGILSKSEVSIPYRQIQDVDIKQTFLHRLLGVARISILTSGHEDALAENKGDASEGSLPLMDKVEAEDMREFLIKKTNVQQIAYEVAEPAPAV